MRYLVAFNEVLLIKAILVSALMMPKLKYGKAYIHAWQ